MAITTVTGNTANMANMVMGKNMDMDMVMVANNTRI